MPLGLRRENTASSVSVWSCLFLVSLKRIAKQKYNCLWCGASPGSRGRLALASSLCWGWELCITAGKCRARTAALPHIGFLGLHPRSLLHQLGGCKGRRERKAVGELGKLPYYLTMSEITKCVVVEDEKCKCFLETVCSESRIWTCGLCYATQLLWKGNVSSFCKGLEAVDGVGNSC